MSIVGIKALVLGLPEVAAWPKMATLFDHAAHRPRPDWDLPGLACTAVGGDVSLAVPAAAAIACMQVSIILVDDMLDDDPRGEHLRSGSGPVANLALSYQALAFRLVERMEVSGGLRAAISASLAWLALTTALGQHWDAQNLKGEENYWKVVRAKSTPFYGAALHIGALLGGASPEVADRLKDLGIIVGEIIQLHDDLLDAFQVPANPDWRQGRNNLLILYACTADQPSSDRFEELLGRIDDPDILQEAQQILIKCGAVSYCAYHLISRHREARDALESIRLADPDPLADLLARQTQPLVNLLRASGADLPEKLVLER